MRCPSVVAIAALGAALAPGVARADARADAKKHFRKGDRLYGSGRFEQAAKEFQESYTLYPNADLLLNVGQSYRMAGKLTKARYYYKLYLEDASGTAHRTEVQEIVRKIDRLLAEEAAARGEPPPAPPPAVDPDPPRDARIADGPPSAADEKRSLIQSWWFWAAVGGVVMIGAGTYAYVHRND